MNCRRHVIVLCRLAQAGRLALKLKLLLYSIYSPYVSVLGRVLFVFAIIVFEHHLVIQTQLFSTGNQYNHVDHSICCKCTESPSAVYFGMFINAIYKRDKVK